MVSKLRRYYNQNRKKIWKIVLIAVAIIIAIRFANYIAKIINKNNENNNRNKISSSILQSESIINDNTLSEDEAQKNNETISKFIDSCNLGNVSEAYVLISDECKAQNFETEEDFNERYYSRIFKTNKSYEKQNWISSSGYTTYLVNFSNDVLTDGGYKADDTFMDYITVVEKNGERKINVMGFISEEIKNETYVDDNIEIRLKKIDRYIDYQTCEVTFINKTDKIININNGDKEWFITDENSSNYYAIMLELKKEDLKIDANSMKTITIKFGKSYNVDNIDKSISFNNMTIEGETGSITAKIEY